jgi:transaldolase
MSEMQGQDRRNMEIAQGPEPKAQSSNPLRALYDAGQSPWYDNIERRLFKTGEFGKLINEYGIVGVTSNPTIFDKAISASNDYDGQIKGFAKNIDNSYEIYDELAVEDISTAADMLLDVYKKTNGTDGYVSIEVLPQYAYDPRKTVEYARRIFQWINRKNILIKVPGTKEALPAITELIWEGINVNATLLFSLSQYEAVAKAYIEGLKKRMRGEERLDTVTSVASVFVSRIDTKIDKMLDMLADEKEDKTGGWEVLDLRGRAAVANSKVIYRRFKEMFFGKEFSELAKKGANIQRVLWASTSTKDPNYKDVKYVEELIGPHSINTMPHQTVLAFYKHGVVRPRIEEGLDKVKMIFDDLNSIGININDICSQLQKEGIKAFSDSFNSLIASIEKKIKILK